MSSFPSSLRLTLRCREDGLSSRSDLGGHHERCAVFAREHGVGLGIVDERLARRVDVELAAEPVGDVTQVTVGAGKMSLLDVGVQETVVGAP